MLDELLFLVSPANLGRSEGPMIPDQREGKLL